MRIAAVLNARSLWWVNLIDLNPFGRSLYPSVVVALRDTYRFQKYPKTPADLDDQAGIRFTDGEFTGKNGVPLWVNLTVYSNGLSVDTRANTRDSDEFIEHVLSSLSRDFGLVYRAEMIRKKAYLSELHVYSENPLSAMHPKLQPLSDRLKMLMPTSPLTTNFQPIGVILGPDPDAPDKPSVFRFERAAGFSWSENRYFSQAPLETDIHRAFLEEFEEILVG